MIPASQVKAWRQPYDYPAPSPIWHSLMQALLDAGFTYIDYDGLGTDVLQRKTEATNLMAQVYGDEVTIYDGRATVDYCFGRTGDIGELRLILACAELEQVME